MISTYQPKRVPKSPLLMLTGPLEAVFCAMAARGMKEPACSPNWARLFCLGWGCLFLGVGCLLDFSCLPAMGMAVSSTACLALGVGSAGALLGFWVVSTLSFCCSAGRGRALTRLT